MNKNFWRNLKIITLLSFILSLILGSDIPWKELQTICFSWPIAKNILYDISVGILSSMILVWCIDRIQLNETAKNEAKQHLILYHKMAPILTKYYEFYLSLYIATRDKPVESNDSVLESLYYCKEELIKQIYNTNPFYKDGYHGDLEKIKLQLNLFMKTNPNDQQAMERIMKINTNVPWYKCWCKDATEFYNNMSQIEREYISFFPSHLLELVDSLLDIAGTQKYIDDFVECKKIMELLPYPIPIPQWPTKIFVDEYKIENVLMLLDEIMRYIENDSEIRLRK